MTTPDTEAMNKPDPRTAMEAAARDADDSEEYCHRCGGPNICWCAPSPLWNEVMRDGDINGEWKFNEIICPVCFAKIAEEKGIAAGWRLYSEDIKVPLKYETPSGRIWNDDSWLWEEPESIDKAEADIDA